MAGERTEPASPRKLRRAREKGQVWRSRDLSGAAVLIAAAGVLSWQGPAIFERLRAFMEHTIRSACSPEPPEPVMVLEAALSTSALCLAPIAVTAMVAAAFVGLLQVRPLWSLEVLKPDLARLNPISGLKKIFSLRALITVALSVGKILLVATVLLWTIAGDLRHLVLLAQASPSSAVGAVGEVVSRLLWRGAAVLAALSLLDVLYQRYQYLKDQRMSKHDVKQEHRETEGDQSQKGERKRLHQELLEQAMLEQVRKADVVIVNPEHLAVALGYDPTEEAAPTVLASGRNVIAHKIIELARQAGVPVLRDVELARSLVEIEVGEHIPEALYEAVAEILRLVMADIGIDGDDA